LKATASLGREAPGSNAPTPPQLLPGALIRLNRGKIMLAFEIIGAIGVALFLAALVGGQSNAGH